MSPADLALLLDSLPFGVVLWRAESSRPEDLRLLYANAGLQRATGYDERQFIGQLMGETYPGAIDPFGRRILEVIESGEASDVEGEFGDENHPLTVYRLQIVPIGDRRAVAITEDVTTLRQLEAGRRAALDQLSAANAELDRFATSVAHDLTTPLVAIKGFASMLPTLADVDGEARDILDRLVASSSRAMAMIDDLLDYARHAGPNVERGAVDMNGVLHWVLDTLADRVATTGAAVRCDPLPPAWGNESALRRVFLNLLDNAIKYARPGSAPRVTVTVDTEPAREGMCRYSVIDEGTGIPAQYREAVLELGVRIGEFDDPAHRGSGIGLATCAAIVAHHGGRIWIEETPGSGGTTVRLTLPAAAVVATPDARPAAEEPTSVFLIDDDPDSRSLIRLIVRDHGGVVVGSAAEGTTALRRLDELDRPPDVVVLDYRLPGDDGLHVARRIRARRPQQAMVLLTSHLDEHLEAAAEAAGIRACLRKQDVLQLGEVMGRLGPPARR